MSAISIDVRKTDGGRGPWGVWLNGTLVSTHRDHSAARSTARLHYIAAVRAATPGGAS